MVRVDIQVSQSGDPEFTALLKALATGRFLRDASLPARKFKSDLGVWMALEMFLTELEENVSLDHLMFCQLMHW